jgi:MarR family transcriptional regulator, multiple antibiotic resistance protein MarR
MQYPRSCPACGAENRAIAKVCDQCGATLAVATETPLPPTNWEADLSRPRVVAARMLNQAYSVSYRLTEHRLRTVGISPVQFRALSLIRLLPPPTTPSVLAIHLALDSRTVSDLVSRLEQSGWVRRVRDLPDRRAVRLELSDEGDRILGLAWSPAIDASDEIWNVVEPHELKSIIRALQRVRDTSLEKLGYRAQDIFALGPPEQDAREPASADR